MDNTVEQVLEEAKARGYVVTMHSGDRTWYGLHHENYNIHLDLYVNTDEFNLLSMKGFIKITTGRCGSFSNLQHFLGIQRQMIEILEKLED